MIASKQFLIRAKVWLYASATAAWHFVTIPQQASQSIKTLFGTHARGWGSLPVTVTLGTSQWHTSIFPDAQSDTYLLPLKANVRKKEKIKQGDTVHLAVEVRI